MDDHNPISLKISNNIRKRSVDQDSDAFVEDIIHLCAPKQVTNRSIIPRKLLSSKFMVPSITILLYRTKETGVDSSSSSEEDDHILRANREDVALVAFEGFSLEACVRPTESGAMCFLRDLQIEDLMQPWGEKFKYLLRTSRNQEGGDADNLIQLEYKATPFVRSYNYTIF